MGKKIHGTSSKGINPLLQQQRDILKAIIAQGKSGSFNIPEFFPLLTKQHLDFTLDIRNIGLDKKALPQLDDKFKTFVFSPLTLVSFFGNANLYEQLIKLGADITYCGPTIEVGGFCCDQPLDPFFCALNRRHMDLAVTIGKKIDFNNYNPGILTYYKEQLKTHPELKKFISEDKPMPLGLFGSAIPTRAVPPSIAQKPPTREIEDEADRNEMLSLLSEALRR